MRCKRFGRANGRKVCRAFSGAGKSRRRKRSSGGLKGCVVKAGPKKGKLKKGYRFSKSGHCVKAKGR